MERIRDVASARDCFATDPLSEDWLVGSGTGTLVTQSLRSAGETALYASSVGSVVGLVVAIDGAAVVGTAAWVGAHHQCLQIRVINLGPASTWRPWAVSCN